MEIREKVAVGATLFLSQKGQAILWHITKLLQKYYICVTFKKKGWKWNVDSVKWNYTGSIERWNTNTLSKNIERERMENI